MGRQKHPGGLIGLLVSGTGASLIGKMIYIGRAEGRDGHMKAFGKPWFCTTLMFVGMAVCLPLSLLWRKLIQPTRFHFTTAATEGASTPSAQLSEQETPLLSHSESTWSLEDVAAATRAWWRRYDAVLFPCIFDLIASALLSVGLLFVTTSLYQMVRGTEVVFTAVLSVLILRRRLNADNLWGLALCAIGLTIVGYSGILNASQDRPKEQQTSWSYTAYASPAETILGMGLIVIAEAVQASQIVVEDWLMTAADTQLPPVEIVGYEGLFGLIVMGGFVLPALQFSTVGAEGGGLREDTIESLEMILRSPRLAGFSCGYVALMALYNLTGMVVTDSMGALSRTVAETARTLLVWGMNLGVYYFWAEDGRHGKESFGEPWEKYSWLQAVGFAFLVVGTALYASGEEKLAKEMKEKLELKARAEWAVLRRSVPRLLQLARLEEEGGGMTAEEALLPIRPARIAGPARIRVALGLLQLRKRLKLVRRGRRDTEDGSLSP